MSKKGNALLQVGNLGETQKKCSCTPGEAHKYKARVSGPLLDRIDIYRSAASYLIQGAARVVVDRDKHSTLKDDSHKLM